MPTKKKRVGFIPRSDVLDLINKLSDESNLSYSKIINILVEEALYERGLFNIITGKLFDEKNESSSHNIDQEKEGNFNKDLNYNYKNNFLKNDILTFKKVKDEPLDNEIYSKFLMFLKFQERMKESDYK